MSRQNVCTESKENLYTYLKIVLRFNYGERQWEIGYTGIQNRYVPSISKVTVLHGWSLYRDNMIASCWLEAENSNVKCSNVITSLWWEMLTTDTVVITVTELNAQFMQWLPHKIIKENFAWAFFGPLLSYQSGQSQCFITQNKLWAYFQIYKRFSFTYWQSSGLSLFTPCFQWKVKQFCAQWVSQSLFLWCVLLMCRWWTKSQVLFGHILIVTSSQLVDKTWIHKIHIICQSENVCCIWQCWRGSIYPTRTCKEIHELYHSYEACPVLDQVMIAAIQLQCIFSYTILPNPVQEPHAPNT